MNVMGMRIRNLREATDLSQGQLGQYANVTRSTLSDLERGEIAPKTVDILVRLAAYFHVSVDYLLGVTDDKRTVADLLALSPYMDMPELLEVGRLLEPLDPGQRRDFLDALHTLAGLDRQSRTGRIIGGE